MTEWFEDRYKQYERAVYERDLIRKNGANAFGDLWRVVLETIKAANNKAMGLTPGGSAQNRFVQMLRSEPFSPETNSRALALSVSNDFRTITAESDAGKVVINVVVGLDNVIGFSKDKGPIGVSDASKLILEPFLFGGESPFSEDTIYSLE